MAGLTGIIIGRGVYCDSREMIYAPVAVPVPIFSK
jgi:hypothetical protein